jgi:hypothetical protein
MTAVDTDNLATRMHRISELTERLLAAPAPDEHARTLAEHVYEEIALARLQIRFYLPHTRTRGASAFAAARVYR